MHDVVPHPLKMWSKRSYWLYYRLKIHTTIIIFINNDVFSWILVTPGFKIENRTKALSNMKKRSYFIKNICAFLFLLMTVTKILYEWASYHVWVGINIKIPLFLPDSSKDRTRSSYSRSDVDDPSRSGIALLDVHRGLCGFWKIVSSSDIVWGYWLNWLLVSAQEVVG